MTKDNPKVDHTNEGLAQESNDTPVSSKRKKKKGQTKRGDKRRQTKPTGRL